MAWHIVNTRITACICKHCSMENLVCNYLPLLVLVILISIFGEKNDICLRK